MAVTLQGRDGTAVQPFSVWGSPHLQRCPPKMPAGPWLQTPIQRLAELWLRPLWAGSSQATSRPVAPCWLLQWPPGQWALCPLYCAGAPHLSDCPVIWGTCLGLNGIVVSRHPSWGLPSPLTVLGDVGDHTGCKGQCSNFIPPLCVSADVL